MSFHDLNQATDALFVWALRTSLEATVLIAVVFIFRLLFGRWLAPLVRYALGGLVLVRLLLPEVPASNFSIFNLKHAWVRPAAEKSLLRIPSAALSPSFPSISREVLEGERTPVANQPEWSLTSIAKTLWMSGFVALLLRVLRQQRKLSVWIQTQQTTTDARLMGLLEDCKTVLKVSRKIRLYKTAELKTPAVFRFWKPCVLLPDDICDRLDDSGLKMIFLHELAHIKRGDVLMNWIVIVAGSLHWFNPAVWLAMRRLRADQELVCDARAMAHLGAHERRVYGNTLLKLMIDFSQARLCPSLLPVITNKQETKRRILMISKFKPTSRAVWIGLAALVTALCCLTFTRAEEKRPKPPIAESSEDRAVVEKQHREQELANVHEGIRAMENELDKQTLELKAVQAHVDELRRRLSIPNDVAEGNAVSIVDPETIRRMETERGSAQARYLELSTLLQELQNKDPEELKNAITVAHPDAILTSLLEAQAQAEQKLAGLLSDLGAENPEVKKVRALETKIRDQITQRLKGILVGLRAKVSAFKAQADRMAKELDGLKQKDMAALDDYRPYFQAKRDLETMKKMRDILNMRILQEKLDANLPRSAVRP